MVMVHHTNHYQVFKEEQPYCSSSRVLALVLSMQQAQGLLGQGVLVGAQAMQEEEPCSSSYVVRVVIWGELYRQLGRAPRPALAHQVRCQTLRFQRVTSQRTMGWVKVWGRRRIVEKSVRVPLLLGLARAVKVSPRSVALQPLRPLAVTLPVQSVQAKGLAHLQMLCKGVKELLALLPQHGPCGQREAPLPRRQLSAHSGS